MAPSTPSPPSPAAPSNATSTLFGYWPGNLDGSGKWVPIPERTQRISTHLGSPEVIRMYMALPPASFQGSTADVGRPVVLSMKIPPAEILSGRDDARLLSFFRSIPADQLVWWSYYHEPEDNIENGEFTAAQYRAAWLHLEALLPKRDNLRPTLILMRWDLHIPDRRPIQDYVTPGLKVLAWDAYIGGADQTVADAFGPAAQVSRQFGLGFAVAETSVYGYAQPQPDWTSVVENMGSEARAEHAQFITWFETVKDGYDWRLSTHSAAAAKWKQLTVN